MNDSDSRVSVSESSLVRLCFDQLDKRNWVGRLYTRFQDDPIPFSNMGEMISSLEQFYDWLGFPQPSLEDRTFRGPVPPHLSRKNTAGRKGERLTVMNNDSLEKKHGEQATFVVRIQYRQNATWQGKVTWAERNKTVHFRSALELLKLIDSTDDSHQDNW